MSQLSTVVETLESRTGLTRRDAESHSEYVDRLGKEFNLSAAEEERLNELMQKEQFAADSSLSSIERRQLDRICAQLSERNEDWSTSESRADSVSVRPDAEKAESSHDINNSFRSDATVGTESVASRETQESSNLPIHAPRFDDVLPDGLTTWDGVFLLPLVAGSLFAFFYGLGDLPLSTWDEGFYANLARHMVQDGYWLTPHMHYGIGLVPSTFEPWLRLPPFGIWLQALTMLVFGVNEFAVRLPSAAASLLTVVVVYFIGRSFRSRLTGFFAGLVYLTTPWVHSGFNAARDGGLDTLLVLFGTLFVYTTWLAVVLDDRRWLYPMGVFAGLAVMTKGFGAGVFLLVVLPLVFFNQSTFVSREMAVATGITSILTIPWLAYMYAVYGKLFVQQIFVRYVFDRVAGGAFGENTNTLFGFMEYPYIKTILFDPSMLHPWIFVLALAIPAFIYGEFYDSGKGGYRDTGFLIWWVIASFGLFVFIGEKPWYLMPMYVPAGVIVGGAIASAIRGKESTTTVVATGILIAIVVSPAYALDANSPTILAQTAVILIGVVVIVWAAPLRRHIDDALPRRVYRGLSRLAPVVIVVVLTAAMVGIPSTTGGNVGQQELAVEVTEHTESDDTVFIELAMPRPFHTFSFYAQRPLESGTVSEFQTSEVQYAVLTNESISRLEVESTELTNTTLRGGQQVSLVRVER